MRLAFVLDEAAHVGGGFQQSLSTIIALQSLRGHEIVALTNRADNVALLRAQGINCELYRFGRTNKAITRATMQHRAARRIFGLLPAPVRRALGPFDTILDRHGIDVMGCFFLSRAPLYVTSRPFITTVYDLCHRERPEFPEVAAAPEFIAREAYFHQTLPRALAVLVSARSLVDRLVRYYGVDPERCITLPFLPGLHARRPAGADDIARVRDKYSLPDNYVFYPAQFWPHKNHIYLLEGLAALATRDGLRPHAVLCGSDFGNQHYIGSTAERLGLTEQIHFLGFVDSADIGALYTGALALVMPTYFGPTNIPPLEALATACPVIYADTPDFRDEFGDSVLYCNLDDPTSLATQLHVLLTQPHARAALRAAGANFSTAAVVASYEREMQVLLDKLEYLHRRWPRRA
jgi:glycosyltransferase involved in cell wall biosynthesis